MSTFGERVKELRKRLGYTQEELAKELGYTSRSTINKIEKGLIDIPLSKLGLFSDVLGADPQFLLYGKVHDWKVTHVLKFSEEQSSKVDSIIIAMQSEQNTFGVMKAMMVTRDGQEIGPLFVDSHSLEKLKNIIINNK